MLHSMLSFFFFWMVIFYCMCTEACFFPVMSDNSDSLVSNEHLSFMCLLVVFYWRSCSFYSNSIKLSLFHIIPALLMQLPLPALSSSSSVSLVCWSCWSITITIHLQEWRVALRWVKFSCRILGFYNLMGFPFIWACVAHLMNMIFI